MPVDVIAENQSEIDKLVAIHTEAIAAKDSEILQLQQEIVTLRQADAQRQIDIDAAEVRGAQAILAHLFRRFTVG